MSEKRSVHIVGADELNNLIDRVMTLSVVYLNLLNGGAPKALYGRAQSALDAAIGDLLEQYRPFGLVDDES